MSLPVHGHKKIFISYSHDSAEHMEKTLRLSNRLRNDGIDSYIDQYQMSPPEGWARFTMREVHEADFVLVVCTEIYHRRSLGYEEKGVGLGVKWESAIIVQELYESEANNTKVIPVILSPEDAGHVPVFLRGTTLYHLYTEEGYTKLYHRLTNRPETRQEELGGLKPLPPVKPGVPEPLELSQLRPAANAVGATAGVEEPTLGKGFTLSVFWNGKSRILSISLLSVWLTFMVFGPLNRTDREHGDDKARQQAESVFVPKVTVGETLRTKYRVEDVALSPDGETLATAERYGAKKGYGYKGAVSLWSLSRADKPEWVGMPSVMSSVAISADERVLAAGDYNGRVWLRQLEGGNSFTSFQAHSAAVYKVYFSADRQQLLSFGWESDSRRTVRLWDVRDRKLSEELLSLKPTDTIISVSPDLRAAAVFNAQTSKAQLRFFGSVGRSVDLEGADSAVWMGAFSRDGQRLALGYGASIRQWRVADGKPLSDLRGPGGEVTAIAFDPYGQFIAAGYDDGRVCLWNVDEPEPFSDLRLHDSSVNALSFDALGRRVVSAGDDKTIRFLRISERR